MCRDGGPETLYPDNYIAALTGLGIVVGTEQGGFSPGSFVTLGQAEAMLTRSARVSAPTFSSSSLPRLPDPPADSAAALTRAKPPTCSLSY